MVNTRKNTRKTIDKVMDKWYINKGVWNRFNNRTNSNILLMPCIGARVLGRSVPFQNMKAFVQGIFCLGRLVTIEQWHIHLLDNKRKFKEKLKYINAVIENTYE
jgi:hypothetical protein